MTVGLGVVLSAALAMALVDIVHMWSGVRVVPADLALWAVLALPLAIGVGILLGAGNATWGVGWLRRMFGRLRDDRDLDRDVAAVLVSSALVGGVLAVAVKILATKLVIEANRQTAGALLLGVVVVALIPILALAVLPAFRVARRITAFVPAIGPMSRVVVLVVGAAVAIVAAGAYVITGQYDYQALNLKAMIAMALLPVIAIVVAILAWGPLAKVRMRVPRPGTFAAAAALVALLLPLVLFVRPTDATKEAVEDRSYFGGLMLNKVLRKLVDFDGDGESALFGGPDCNDFDATINSKATDIPGDGIDQNCDGEDAEKDDVVKAPPVDAAPPPPGVDAAPPLSGGTNLLVIFVDTLRFDRLGVSGYKRDGASLTPRIDAFAEQGVVFEKAFSQAPNTPRSVPSFMTSHYPSQVKYDQQFKSYATVLDDNDTLFEAFKAGGFHTIGESSHFYFCDRVKYPESCDGVVTWMKSNITQGADEWDNTAAENIPGSNSDIAGPRIVKKTVAKLDELAKPGAGKFAMLVHLFEPHSTYMTHPGFKYNETGIAGLAQKYDYEVAFEDGMIGQLLDALDKNGLAKTTTVVLMSDHGEAFGVHTFAGQEMLFHGQTLYRELIHVPLIFRVPGGKPQRRSDVVQLIDLAPTLTALFGVQTPPSWQGRSLVPALEGKPLDPMPAFSELLPEPQWDHDAKSMISSDGKTHVFFRISDDRWEFYDIVADPDETKRLDEDDTTKALRKQLLRWRDGSLKAGKLK